MPPTDPGLDERVCRKLGWEPRVEWVISRDGGESRALSFGGEESVARTWLALKHSDGLYMDYETVRHEVWPPISTSWEWAGKALDRLGKARLWARISGPHHYADGTTLWGCSIYGTHASTSCTDRQAATAPLAIARAIDAALPEVKG